MRFRNSRAAALAALVAAAPVHAAPCAKIADALASAPKFAGYRVAVPERFTTAPVDIRHDSGARLFRTALREAAKAGPNFAGTYTVAGWGCGTSCLDWGVIDGVNGKVAFDPKTRTVENLSDDWDRYKIVTEAYAGQGANAAGFDQLLFRRDSALLVVLGAPGEDEARDGIAYYRWTGKRLARVHFIAAKSLCRPG